MAAKSTLQPADWKEQLTRLSTQDIKATRNEYYFPAPEWLVSALVPDKRDYPLFYLMWNTAVSVVVQLLLLPFMLNTHWVWLALMSSARAVLISAPRFILGLHFSAHRPAMRPKWLGSLIWEYLLAPFAGIPCGCYSAHHVIMHHREDNIHPKDLSSTMPYQRDNFLHFLHYWARFEFAIWFELPYYAWRKRMYARCLRAMVCMWFGHFGAIYLLWQWRPAFAVWILLVPQVIASLALMFGNWSQHIFVDPDVPDDDHRLTVNLLATPYNQLTFNDGYHILHHKYPILHWSELPSRFLTDKEIALHAKSNAINLFDIDYFILGVMVMTGQLRAVANKFVPVSDAQAKYTEDDVVALFKRRLQPIPTAAVKKQA